MKKALEISPDRKEIKKELVDVYRKSGKVEDEIEALKQLLAEEGDKVEYYKRLLELYEKLNKEVEVISTLKKLIEIDGGYQPRKTSVLYPKSLKYILVSTGI